MGIYCIDGKEYEVIDIGDNDNYEECFLIETEEDIEMQIKMDDADFEVIIKPNILVGLKNKLT